MSIHIPPRRFTLVLVQTVLLVLAARAAATPPSLRVERLRCEMRTDPLDVETQSPRLSWIINSDTRRQRQTGYHILAASAPDLLLPGNADLYDSGRRESAQSIHVAYEGKPLRSGQQVFWTVKVWGRDGSESDWAKPARWTMAIFSPGEWKAKWITDTRAIRHEPPAIARGNWIWHAADDAIKAPVGTRHFRRAFTLPADAKLEPAALHLAADNEAVIHLNGQLVGKQDNWAQPTCFDVSRLLKRGGENVLTVAVTNTADHPNPAGLIALLEVADKAMIATDTSWQSGETPSIDGAAPANVVARWGEAPWQKADNGDPHPPLPIFRKTFNVEKQIRRALLRASAPGHYKLYLNGKPVGDDFLDPAWSKYPRTVYYNSFDITSLLSRDENVIGAVVGRSYYATKGDRRIHAGVFDNPIVLLAQLDIEYEDGSRATIATDNTWRWTVGPYTHCSIIGGVDYDARMLPEGWASSGFNDVAWKAAKTINPKLGALASPTSPPLRTFDRFKPISVSEPAAGRFVYDFGQNASATVRLKVKGHAGAKFRLTYAEQRHGQSPHCNDGKGLVDQSGIGVPNYIEYTLRGPRDGSADENWFCDQFYTGFQYLQLDGAVPAGAANPDDKPIVTDIVSVHVRSSAPAAGTFACSNSMYEKIDRMIEWSVRNNLSHVLTDCPHREKLGWLEVPHLMWDSMAYRFDLSGFGPKVCRDIADSQTEDGSIPTVAPSYSSFGGAFGYTPEWGAAGVLIPWYVYEWYGDRRNLEASYQMMRRFVDYMKNTSTDLVPKAGLGDWYDYGHGQALGPSKFTPPDLSAMAIFHDCARRVADAAKVLDKPDDERAYRSLASNIRSAFNKRWYEGNGRYRNNGSCQTANAMALVCGLVEASEQQRVAAAMVEDLKQRNYQQTSGDVGFHYLVRGLTDFGHSEALFRILNRDKVGSYAFLVNAGWTSLPEAWDADRNSSMNHCMLGHIQEWFNRDLAGIQPEAVAFKRIRIRPVPGPGVDHASATLQTPYGQVSSKWTQKDGGFTMEVVVPVNTTAAVHVPAAAKQDVTHDGDPESVRFVEMSGGRAVFDVGSGGHRFASNAVPPRR